MKETKLLNSSRRQFLAKTLPVCAATCLGAGQAFSETAKITDSIFQQDKYKFDKEIKFTVKQLWEVRANTSLALIMPIVEAMGEEKAIEFLKGIAYKRASSNGALRGASTSRLAPASTDPFGGHSTVWGLSGRDLGDRGGRAFSGRVTRGSRDTYSACNRHRMIFYAQPVAGANRCSALQFEQTLR